MTLPEPRLDDLRFQHDLVDEARRRIIRYCPEWTDYNLSDPGITLIELFAWMTELLTYRLNRVPEKNYLKFLDLLDVQLCPPSSARVELTFWLSTPFPIAPESTLGARVPTGTEIATQQLEEGSEIIFSTDTELVIAPPRLIQLRRGSELTRNYLPRLGIETFHVFQQKPAEGDTFYLGFDPEQSLAGQLLQLSFECEETRAVGIRREDPPLIWEASQGEGAWVEVPPSTRAGERDTTGGLNNPVGKLVLYLPLEMRPDVVQGRRAYWLRCRFEQRRPEQGRYSQSPRLSDLQAYTLGGTVRATHAVVQADERLGVSNGEDGQTFQLRHVPLLMPTPDETVAVEELRAGELVFIPWERVPDFATSTRYDRHFTLDEATGEVAFGPRIRQADGTVRQYGRIPAAGRRVYFTRYRYGGGVQGNVPVGKIEVLRTSLPYIDRVTNLQRADGGRDQESLAEAKMRARREMRMQRRAVTAEDFENLTRRVTRSVARVKCRGPRAVGDAFPPGMIELLVIPAVMEAVRAGDFTHLTLPAALREEIIGYLDHYRLLTTTLQVREPRYLGVAIITELVAHEYSHPETVRARVAERLRHFLAPLALGDEEIFSAMLGQRWEGWPFGRDLYVSELFSLVQQVPGVKHLLEIEIRYRPVVPGEDEADAETLKLLTGRVLSVPEDTVLCSLSHQVEVVEL
ncbi:MAG: putative baseplate assembly protein [Chloroflexota bacterium]|nr:putative baseplate assembly protein [Chloroflexota bacterium]